MKSYFLEKAYPVNSKTFTKQFLTSTLKLQKDSIVAFMGPLCIKMGDDDSEDLDILDLECEKMLHFMICKKRLVKRELILQLYFFNSLIADLLGQDFKRDRSTVLCRGIPVTLSGVRQYKDTSLIDVGVFIKGERHNRPSLGLEALNIKPKGFALDVLFEYVKNIKEMSEYAQFVKLSI